MSEYIDDLLECGFPDDGMGPAAAADYLDMSDDELRKECARARNKKILGIRNWPHPLSEKQRWCLACWCAERDNRETNAAVMDARHGDYGERDES
jgi:hypothetical protein